MTITAAPFAARRCPACKTWIYTADGPFSEGDPTRTVADWLHWEAEHLDRQTGETRCAEQSEFKRVRIS